MAASNARDVDRVWPGKFAVVTGTRPEIDDNFKVAM